MIKDMIKKFNNNIRVLDHSWIVDTFLKDKLLDLVGITNWIQSEVLIINKAYGLDEWPMLRNQFGQAQCITLVRGRGMEFIYDLDNQYIYRDPFTIGEELQNYLKNKPKVPNGINIEKPNSLKEWLNKL